jgi:NAD(P)-dependent dehydrogenase (short-subunit alcohol dehydrogenase family)
MGWLDGQVALVTGGGSGIGQAIVTRFVQEGARVGVMDRVAARVDKLQTDLGKSVVAIGGDASSARKRRSPSSRRPAAA